ncbi:MAG: threonine--tRNA ligase [Candidatus Marinimicrobia bacterium]|nr:threonine--tRNA ligase [Candidatus Neomarinimicrobiota bacterium]
MNEIFVTVSQGEKRSFPIQSTPFEIFQSLEIDDLHKIIAASVDGKSFDLHRQLDKNCEISPIFMDSAEGHEIILHSTSHILAQAVKRLFPKAQVTIGPAIENGFYYDFSVENPFTPEDLKSIQKEMKKIIKKKYRVERKEMAHDEAITLFEKIGEDYKVEIIRDLEEDTVSLYEQDDFLDLCRGPHLPHTGRVPAFKLMSTGGAYWRGDENNEMLQRIYGTAFPTKDLLNQYLEKIEEAKKRDHRRLGKDLDLFSVTEDVGPGLVHWHPKGARIRSAIEDFWRSEHYKNGYEILYSPHIGKAKLWETSGHLDFYRDGMYAPMEIDGMEYFVKPMNCPFHIQIYQSQMRSYRDLPLRWAELGTVYRYEKAGVLHGLLRVRGFTQDDAHIFCTPEQIEDEIVEVIRFSNFIWKTFGFTKIKAYLSTRPEKAVGEESRWDQATKSLESAIKAEGLPYEIDEGGGAFYGPKIDLKVEDAIGREWQMSTIQFDFNLPERFDLSYVGADGELHRPYMVHRALFGSLERFFGILVEHFAGAFPLWLAPEQVALIPIADRHLEHCYKMNDELKKHGIRSRVDDGGDRMNYKIRVAQKQKIPMMLVVGDREIEENGAAVRLRSGDDMGTMSLDKFLTYFDNQLNEGAQISAKK